MDDYKVIALNGARMREKPSINSAVLFTFNYNSTIEIDKTITAEGAVWCHSFTSGGWIRSDLLERYASAEPMPVIVTDDPTDARYSLGYTAGWNARGEADKKAKRTE